MSGPQANMEFVDVLSSIRRLVSEHKRTEGDALDPGAFTHRDADPLAEMGDPQPDAVPTRLPRESRLVLTAALRVSPEDYEGEASEEAGFDPDEAESLDGLGPVDDALPMEEAPELQPDAESAPPLVATSGDMSAQEGPSLEATIAELEAAVADIDEDFEPDMGDLSMRAHRPAPDALWQAAGADEPADMAPPAFRGVMAGFGSILPEEERLDQPIIGDLAMPIIPRGDSWRVSLPQRRAENAPSPDQPAAQTDSAAAPDGVLRDADPVQAAEAAPATRGLTGLLVLDAASAVAAPPAQAGPAMPDPETATDMPARPTIIRAEATEPCAEETIFSFEDDPDAGEAAMDLFAPDAAFAGDTEALRDLIAEVIRDELRGALGEQLTRNVRVLIRREIARILAEQGLTRA